MGANGAWGEVAGEGEGGQRRTVGTGRHNERLCRPARARMPPGRSAIVHPKMELYGHALALAR